MKRNAVKCREKQKIAKKCIEISRSADKCNEMEKIKRNAENCKEI